MSCLLSAARRAEKMAKTTITRIAKKNKISGILVLILKVAPAVLDLRAGLKPSTNPLNYWTISQQAWTMY